MTSLSKTLTIALTLSLSILFIQVYHQALIYVLNSRSNDSYTLTVYGGTLHLDTTMRVMVNGVKIR